MIVMRWLPSQEWDRLEGTELAGLWSAASRRPLLNPRDIHVLVGEEDGRIIATWAAIRYWHLEGAWIAPDHRRDGVTARRGLGEMRRWLNRVGATGVLTCAVSPDVASIVEKLGGIVLPGTHYLLPVVPGVPPLEEGPPCPQ